MTAKTNSAIMTAVTINACGKCEGKGMVKKFLSQHKKKSVGSAFQVARKQRQKVK
jgi:hypothetical protein